MAQFSLNKTWDEAKAFLQAERHLVIPVGLATLGLAMLLASFTIPEGQNPEGVPPGPWMFGLIPICLLFLLGNIAVSAIVLIPRISVREALGVAFSRLGTAALVLLAIGAILLVLIVIVGLLAGVLGTTMGLPTAGASALGVMLALLPMLWLSIRLLPIWPLLSECRLGIADTLRRSFALSRGHFARLALAMVVYGFAYILVMMVIQIAAGSLLLLLGKLLGSPGVGRALTAVLVSLAGGVLSTGWVVFVAFAYRRLSGSISGT